MTIDDVLTEVIRKEGGYVNDPADRGGATHMGITAGTLGRWRGLGRAATPEEVKALTESEARAIYAQQYVVGPGFDNLPDWLMPILVDDGVLSGPKTAITTLQGVLNVPQDGVLGPKTLRAVATQDRAALLRALVAARAVRFARIVERNPSQAKFLVGWITRALSFLA